MCKNYKTLKHNKYLHLKYKTQWSEYSIIYLISLKADRLWYMVRTNEMKLVYDIL